MSVKVMTLVWNSTIASTTDKMVLLALGDRARDDGICWPGVENLVKKTSLSRATVFAAIKRLEDAGFLERAPRTRANGATDRNAYRVNMRALRHMQHEQDDEPEDDMAALFGTAAAGEQGVQQPDTLGSSSRTGGGPAAGRAGSSSRTPVGSRSRTPNTSSTSVDTSVDTSGGARKRGTRLPADFNPLPSMLDWVRKTCPLVDHERANEKFKNYWTAKTGAQATKLDWPATWRNWMLTEQERAERFAPRPSSLQPRISAADRSVAEAELLKDDPDPRVLELFGYPPPLRVLSGGAA